jgi:glucosyl-3-phosphoglycerate synthase
MCDEVAKTLFTTVEEHGFSPDYERLRAAYRDHADRLVRQYAGDAAFNGFEYDPQQEREQVETYATSITPPGEDNRLPSWETAPLDPETLRTRSEAALDAHR